MLKKIVIVDSFSYYSFHEVFNAQMLAVYANIFDQVSYYGQKSSINNIEKILGERENVSFHFLRLVSFKGRWGLLLRYIFAAFMTAIMILKCRNETHIALNNNNPFLLPLLCLVLPFVKAKLLICCHGELELLLPNKNGGLFAKWQQLLLRNFFFAKKINKRITFIVLGESILENIRMLLPTNNTERFRAINHPYKFNSNIEEEIYPTDEIRIGIIGQTNKTKGYDLLVQLATMLNKRKSNINIFHIGKLVGDTKLLQSMGVKVVQRDDNGDLAREEYIKWVSSLHYTLFLYPTDSYKLIASGAIFESIASRKPIIALHNDFFDYIFKLTGKIGYMFDSIDKLEQFIECLNFDSQEYRRMMFAMSSSEQMFSVESIEKTIRYIWE